MRRLTGARTLAGPPGRMLGILHAGNVVHVDGPMLRWSRILVVLILLVAGMPVAAEAPVLDDPRLGSSRPEIAAALEAARREELPEDWLERKVREGLSKRVPPSRIAEAVSALLDRMRVADRILDAGAGSRAPRDASRKELLRTVTEALATGAPAEGLERLVRGMGRDAPRERAAEVREVMIAVAELGERGVDGPTSVEAAHRAYSRAGLRGMRALVESSRNLGHLRAEERRARILERAAAVERIPPGRNPQLERPSDRGGPPRDDAMGQGKGRGKAGR